MNRKSLIWASAGALLLCGHAFAQGASTSPLMNDFATALSPNEQNQAGAISTAATGDLVPCLDISDTPDALNTCTGANLLEIEGVTASATELNYIDLTTLGTGAASKAIVLDANSDYTAPAALNFNIPSGGDMTFASGSTLDASGTFEIGNVAVTATAAEINKNKDSTAVMTKGAGVSAMETYASGVILNGTLKVTRIIVDLTGLVGSGTDLDIIGNTGGAASAHMGQVTVALNGTMVGGSVTCLEVPAGGTDDIDFYTATVSTGAQDGLVTDLTETVLVTSGGAWTSGATKGMTTVPPANGYIYITNGAAAGGTFTAGKFLITLYGV